VRNQAPGYFAFQYLCGLYWKTVPFWDCSPGHGLESQREVDSAGSRARWCEIMGWGISPFFNGFNF
jgi:hypothetical protein